MKCLNDKIIYLYQCNTDPIKIYSNTLYKLEECDNKSQDKCL